MNITLSKGAVVSMAPQAADLKEGDSIQVEVVSSRMPNGYTTVNIKRMTEEYFYVSELSGVFGR